MEAEEIARLAVDLERAVRASNAEAEKRRQAETRLEAAHTRVLHLETGSCAVRSSSPPRSRSKLLSPRCNGSPARSRPQKAAGGARGGLLGPESGFRREEAPEANGGREAGLVHPSGGALGSTIASRARCTSRDGPASRRNGNSEGGPGRSPGSPRRGRRDAETKEKKRPWGSSPPPSPRRVVRPPGGAGASSPKTSEQKRFPVRQSDEKSSGIAVGGIRTDGRHGADPALDRGRTRPREGLQEASSSREGRHPSPGGREAGASTDEFRGYSASDRREGREVPIGEDGIAGAAADWRRPRGDGRDTAMAGASYLGVDLTATIARELRAAVATTPASTVSPGSANFNGGGSGHNTPALGNGTNARAKRGEEPQDNIFGSALEEGGGALLQNIRRGGSKLAWDDANSGMVGVSESLGEGGRGLKSREVAELESDVQHIFQFFAAKDGRRRSGLPSTMGRGENGETGVSEDIAKALS